MGDLNLDRILRARGGLPREVLVDLAIRICEAVDAAGDQIRVLEPATIGIGLDGSVPTKGLGAATPRQSHDGAEAVYEAPEAREGHGGPRARVFVLGAILYEMATGEALFSGRRAASGEAMTSGLERRLQLAGIPDLHDRATRGFGTVLHGCLRLDRAQRFETPGEVARELRVVQMEAKLPDADLDSFLLAVASISIGGPLQVEMDDDGLDHDNMVEDEYGNWSIPTAAPSGGRELKLQQSTAEHEIPARPAGASAEPWAATDVTDETDDMVRERLEQSRLTRVDRTANVKTLEEEPTFGKAVRWFVKRVALLLFVVALLLFGAAWMGTFPGGTERLAARGYDAVPSMVRDRVPATWVSGTKTWWAGRPGQDIATPVGARLLPYFSEPLRRELSPEPPTPPPTSGDLTFEGVVTLAEGWIEPVEDLAEEERGRLKLLVDFGGRPRGEKVTVRAHPPGSDEVVAEGTADQPLLLPPAHYDLELSYRESEFTDARPGWIRGAAVSAGHLSAYLVTLDAPLGFAEVEIGIVAGTEDEEAEEGASPEAATRRVHLDGWREPVGAGPSGEPDFSGPGGSVIALDVGRWRVRATVSEEGRADAVAWFRNVPVDKGELVKLRRADLRRGEELAPAGPGLRIAATNGGRDVSERVRVMAFAPGDKPSSAIPTASGPAAYYFPVSEGNWDVYVVYVPNPEEPSLRAQQKVQVQLAPGQVLRRTVEMGLPIAYVSAELWTGDEERTESMRTVVLKAGADFEAATRLVDEEGRGPHPVAPGSYDIYVQSELADGWRITDIHGVTLAAGDEWAPRLLQDKLSWHP